MFRFISNQLDLILGVILVHDLTNRKSLENLEYWIKDFMQFSNDSRKHSYVSHGKSNSTHVFLHDDKTFILGFLCFIIRFIEDGEIEVKIEDGSTWRTPVLMVGTKLDLVVTCGKFNTPFLTQIDEKVVIPMSSMNQFHLPKEITQQLGTDQIHLVSEY